VGKRHTPDLPIDLPDESAVTLSEILRLSADRKLDATINDLAIIFRELAGEVVESGPELVQDFTDVQAPFGGREASRKGLDEQVSRLGLEIWDNTVVITLEKGFDFFVQSFRALYAPYDFGNLEQRVRGVHEVSSRYEKRDRAAEAADEKGSRNPRAKAQGFRDRSRQGSESAEALNYAPTEEVAPQTSSAESGADCTAKRTHSGSPEDA